MAYRVRTGMWMNYLKFSLTLLMVAVSAFVMIYVVEGYYEARTSQPVPGIGGFSREGAPAQAPWLAQIKTFFSNPRDRREAPLDFTASQARKENEIHHGLSVAAMTGDFEKTKMLLDAGISANTRDAFGIRAVTRATLWGRSEVVRLLLDRGADVNEKERLGVTLLMLAANQGDEKLLRLFLEKGADLDAESEDGETALTTAMRKGHAGIARILKSQGARVPEGLRMPEAQETAKPSDEKRSFADRLFFRDRRSSREHETGDETAPSLPSESEAEFSESAGSGELLNRPGEELRALSSDALTWAANVSKDSLAQESEAEARETALPKKLPSRAETPARSDDHGTDAGLLNAPPDAALLTEAMDASIADLQGRSDRNEAPEVSSSAEKNGQGDVNSLSEEQMLQEALAALNRRLNEPKKISDLPGWAEQPAENLPAASPLAQKPAPRVESAVEKPPVTPPAKSPVFRSEPPARPLAQRPLARPVNAAARAAASKDLLQASLAGDLARVRSLLAGGADVNTRGSLDMTPLMIAAQDGHLLVVKFLIQNGADIHARNLVGQTALRLASLREREAVMAVLKSAGAQE